MIMLSAKEQVLLILHGIDIDQTFDNDGWFETDAGVEFGADRLKEVLAVVEDLELIKQLTRKLIMERDFWLDVADKGLTLPAVYDEIIEVLYSTKPPASGGIDMTEDEAIKGLDAINSNSDLGVDTGQAHADADHILLSVLQDNGYHKVVAAYNNLYDRMPYGFWYS